MNSSRFLFLIFPILFITNANAQESPLYIGGDIGYTKHSIRNVHIYESGINWTDSYDVIKSLNSNSFSILGGYKLNDKTRFELKYNYSDADKKQFYDNVIYTNRITIEQKIHKLMLDTYYDFYKIKDFSLYAGGGLGISYTCFTSSVNNAGVWGYSDRTNKELGLAWELATGIDYKLSKKINLDFQYTYTDIGRIKWQAKGNDGTGGVEHFAGDWDVKQQAFSLGLRYNF